MATSSPRMSFKKKSMKQPKKDTGLPDLSKRLYLRMRRRIKEAHEVQDLHPLIKKVIIPRQRGRFCFLEFETSDDATKALAEIKAMKFEKGKHLVIRKATAKGESNTADDQPIKFRIQKTGRKNMNMDKLLNTTETDFTKDVSSSP